MKKYLYYFLLPLLVVFACGAVPALGYVEVHEEAQWVIALWAAMMGSFACVGGYWTGCCIEGNEGFDGKKLLVQLVGCAVGGFFACGMFLIP